MSEDHTSTCYHCGLPAPSPSPYVVEVDGAAQPMCCPGCQAVAQAILNCGLGDFYRYRSAAPRNPEQWTRAALDELALYDNPQVQRSFVHGTGAEVREAALIMEGIVCAACVWLNERYVSELPGVVEFTINYATHRARLRWNPDEIQLSAILQAIRGIGYQAHPYDPGRQQALHERERKLALRRIAVAALGMAQIMMLAVAMYAGESGGMEGGLRDYLRWISLLIAVPVVGYSARPFFSAAFRDLRTRRLSMDVPVALAIGIAFLASVWATLQQTGEVYFDSVSMFTLFLLSGRYLEMQARHRAGAVAQALVRLTPATTTRLEASGPVQIAVGELAAGDRVLVRPGETIPADGVLEDGYGAVDEALLSGESLPVDKAPGARLVGGSVNLQSPLTIRVDRVGQDTVVAAIVRLLERAQTEKPRLARAADRVAAWFVGAVLVTAALVFAYWWQQRPDDALWITLSVLVVTCPCALSLATPAALVAATGRLTQMGLLVTRGHALETLARASHLLLDKTGTLTAGRLQLEHVEPLGSLDASACLDIARALEIGSEHAVAKALQAAHTAPPAATAESVQVVAGQGVEGHIGARRYRIGRPAYVAALAGIAAPADLGRDAKIVTALGDEQGLLALLSFADQLRPQAAQSVAALRELGITVEMLSGDRQAHVDVVARPLALNVARGDLLPEQKLARLRELQAQGAVVVMVGDGVNDAPVLAGAQASIAMGSGTQLAQASADMVLLSERLGDLPAAVRVARRTLRIIRQNLAWAILYNLVALPLAAMGWIAPWMAAIGMSLSSLLVVLNALRLAAPKTVSQQVDDSEPVRRASGHTPVAGSEV